MSRRFKRIIQETTHRWRETITSTAEPDIAGAEKLLQKAFSTKPRIFTAKSPAEFYIAQAVLRGRVAKKSAERLAEKLGINKDFIKPLTRVGAPQPMLYRAHSWSSPGEATNMLLAVMQRHFINNMSTIATSAQYTGGQVVVRLQSLRDLYRLVMPSANNFMPTTDPDKAKLASEISHMDWRLNFNNAQKHVELSCHSLFDAVSGHISDIMAGGHVPTAHKFDAVQTEILCKALGATDVKSTWSYEIFHHVPAFMQFNHNSYLLLVGKPQIQVNAEDQLHCATGPAVAWPDGKKNWYVDGHYLAQFGEQIVMTPELMTKDMIYEISNEEERRIAIDRMGWNKYLAAIGARVTSSRENWVDNTFEVLIEPPVLKNGPLIRREEPMRMVLSCRSTGRKYFIAVPRDIPHPDRPSGWMAPEEARKYPNIKIKTCEDAQKWLADGANTKYLEYAKHPINVVGAS